MAVDAIIPESPNGPVARAVEASVGKPRVRAAAAVAAPPKVRVAAAVSDTPVAQAAEVTAAPKVHVAAAVSDTPVAQASAVTATPKVRVASAASDTPAAQASAVTPPPKVRVATAASSTAQMRVASASAGTPQVRVVAATPVIFRSNGGFDVKEDLDGIHLLKWVCIGLSLLLLLVLGGNYLLVDQPLVSNLGKTSYSKVTVYGHLGAFVQPNVLVIHIPASSAITPDNVADFIVALAQSTPQSPITRDDYSRVALTSEWTAQYSFSGGSWKELGEMRDEDKAELKGEVLSRLADAGGNPLMPESTLNEAAQQAARERVWDTFATRFTANR
jgi:hypothetical protein